MRLLFICNTYMQVITAVQMKLKLYPDAEADMMVSDDSVNAERVTEGLAATGVFNRVKFIKVRHLDRCPFFCSSSRIKNFRDTLSVFTGDRDFKEVFWKDDFVYDVLCYFNTQREIQAAFVEITRHAGKNNIPEVIRFEEGLLAYLAMLNFPIVNRRSSRIFFALQRMLNRNTKIFLKDKLACFYPELLSDLYRQQGVNDIPECIKIPAVTCDKKFLNIINTAFSYDPASRTFPQKYIYFSGAMDWDGIHCGESEIVFKLAELVGRDNLLVKMHPRDRSDIYERAGLIVSRDNSVPWEVIQLNHDFSRHVFLSFISSSIVNTMAMKNESIPSYFLYPMAEDQSGWFIKTITDQNRRIMNGLNKMGLCKSIKIINSFQEIVD